MRDIFYTEKIISVQEFANILGKKYLCGYEEENVTTMMELYEFMERNNLSTVVWDYPLTEIEHCIENEITVVLVADNKLNARLFEFDGE